MVQKTGIEWSSLPWQRLAEVELGAQWDALNRRGANAPFLAADAACAALRAFAEGGERLLVARTAGQVVAMLVMAAPAGLRRVTFQPSQVPLGLWVTDPGWPLDDLLRSVLRGPLGRALSISLLQADPCFHGRPQETAASTTVDYISTAWVELAASFDDYWAGRGKNLKRNLRRARDRLAAAGIRPRLEVITAAAGMQGGVERYGQLERRGWKAAAGTAIGADNGQARFYADFLALAAARQEAAIYELWLDDRLAASNLCVLRDGVMTILKTAYDEELADHSPAFLLSEDLLRQVHAGGHVHRVEYYGRVMEWHRRWTTLERVLYHVTVYRWPLVKRLARLRHRLPDAGQVAGAPASQAGDAGAGAASIDPSVSRSASSRS